MSPAVKAPHIIPAVNTSSHKQAKWGTVVSLQGGVKPQICLTWKKKTSWLQVYYNKDDHSHD